MTLKDFNSIISLRAATYDCDTKFGVSAVLKDGRRITIAKGKIEKDKS